MDGRAVTPAGTGLPREWGVVTRRRLLALSGAAIGVVTVAELERAVPRGLLNTGQPAFTRSRFAPFIGRRVELGLDDGTVVAARLESIEDLPGPGTAASADPETSFALLFRGPDSPRLPQALVTVRAPRLGSPRLLLAPASIERGPRYYAAVINQAHLRHP